MNPPEPEERKPPEYYGTPRTDLLGWAGIAKVGRVLDVGCGAGANAEWLRKHGAGELVGVEPDVSSARIAEKMFDEIFEMPIEQALPKLHGPFDAVICADVLEHLLDPAAVLHGLRRLVSPDGRLVVSTPNIRYVRALARIAFGAGFRPEESGTFDSTHIRFFTRANLRDLVAHAGWEPRRWGYPRSTALGLVRSALGTASRGVSDEWLAAEWFLVAQPRSSTPDAAPLPRRPVRG